MVPVGGAVDGGVDAAVGPLRVHDAEDAADNAAHNREDAAGNGDLHARLLRVVPAPESHLLPPGLSGMNSRKHHSGAS